MDKIIIYTDGACEVHKSRVSGWGAILMYQNNVVEICGGENNSTNNRAEIKACIEALKYIETNDIPIEIYSDSALVVDCFKNEWYQKWRENGWRKPKSKVKNVDLWKELVALVELQEDCTFHKVKGHSGNIWNEKADSLANIGLEKQKSKMKEKN